MAKKAAGTPATVLLTAQNIPHSLHPYDVSPDAPNYGALVAEASGSRRPRCSRPWSPRSTGR
jgi:Cys-tRNA(Pro)/Cys-tRNA(Cys) deacylase